MIDSFREHVLDVLPNMLGPHNSVVHYFYSVGDSHHHLSVFSLFTPWSIPFRLLLEWLIFRVYSLTITTFLCSETTYLSTHFFHPFSPGISLEKGPVSKTFTILFYIIYLFNFFHSTFTSHLFLLLKIYPDITDLIHFINNHMIIFSNLVILTTLCTSKSTTCLKLPDW